MLIGGIVWHLVDVNIVKFLLIFSFNSTIFCWMCLQWKKLLTDHNLKVNSLLEIPIKLDTGVSNGVHVKIIRVWELDKYSLLRAELVIRADLARLT